MRDKIWEKDDFFEVAGKRVDMDPSVVKLPSEARLAWQFIWTEPVGRVTDIRFEDGEITGVVEVFNKTVEELGDSCRLGGHYKEIFFTDESQTRVKSATLIGVSFVLKTNMPGYPKE